MTPWDGGSCWLGPPDDPWRLGRSGGKQRLRWARVGPGTRADLRDSRTLLPTPKGWVWQGGIQEGGEFQLPSSRAGDSLVRDAWVGELEC